MLFEPLESNAFFFTATVGGGQVYTPPGQGDCAEATPEPGCAVEKGPLTINITNHWILDFDDVLVPNVDELLEVSIQIDNLHVEYQIELDFNLNDFFLLDLREIVNASCILALVDHLNITQTDVSTDDISFFITQTSNSQDLGGANGRPAIAVALESLAIEAATETILATGIQYVVESWNLYFRNFVNNRDWAAGTIEGCSDHSPIVSLLGRLAVAAYNTNITEVLIDNFETSQSVPLPHILDNEVLGIFPDSEYLDFSDSIIGRVITSTLADLTNAGFEELLSRIGNATIENDVGDKLEQGVRSTPEGNQDFLWIYDQPIGLDLFVTGGIFHNLTLHITNLNNFDMDAFKVLHPYNDPLNPSKFVTQTFISIPGDMDFYLDFTYSVPGELFGDVGTTEYEVSTLHTGISDFLFDSQLLAALNWDYVRSLSLGNFFEVDENQVFYIKWDARDCFFRSFYGNGLWIPKVDTSVSDWRAPKFGSTNKIFSKPVEDSFNAVIELYVDMFFADLSLLSQGFVRDVINDFILKPGVAEPGPCPLSETPPLAPEDLILSFVKSSTVKRLSDFVSVWLAGENKDFKILNDALKFVFEDSTFFNSNHRNELGEVEPQTLYVFDNFVVRYKEDFIAKLSLLIGDLRFKGMGTWGGMSILNPTSAYSVSNNFTIDGPVTCSLALTWILDGSDGELDLFLDEPLIRDDIRISITWNDIYLAFEFLMKLNIPAVLDINIGSLADVKQLRCVLKAIEEFTLLSLDTSFGDIEARIECVGSCNSPLLSALDAGGVAKQTVSGDIVDDLIGAAETYLKSYVFKEDVDKEISNADQGCAVALDLTTAIEILNPQAEHHLDIALISGLGFSGILCAVLCLMLFSIPRHTTVKKKYMAIVKDFTQKRVGSTPKSVEEMLTRKDLEITALFNSPYMPAAVRFGVPILCVVNIVALAIVFVWLLSFTFDTSAKLLGSQTRELSVVPFSVPSTINDLWNSGAWPLALLVVVASCAWPVLKNLVLFYCWFAPSTLISKHFKHFLLEQLDWIGKWSLLDVYVVVIVVAALKVTVSINQLEVFSKFPQDFVTLNFIGTPNEGTILLSIAACSSLIVNHIIIYYNDKNEYQIMRSIKAYDNVEDPVIGPPAKLKIKICDYVFSTYTPKGHRDSFSKQSKYMLTIFCIFALVLNIVALFFPLITLKYEGVAGIILQTLDSKLGERTFTLFSMGIFLSEAVKENSVSSSITIFFFQFVYFISIAVAPATRMAGLVFLWLWPLNYSEAKTTIMACRVMGYWAAVDVFYVSIVAVTLEITPITAYMMSYITGGVCRSARPFLESQLDEAGRCLIVTGEIPLAGIFVIFAWLMQFIAGVVMLRACRVALRDREYILERTPMAYRKLGYDLSEYVVCNMVFRYGAAHHNKKLAPKEKLKGLVDEEEYQWEDFDHNDPMKSPTNGGSILGTFGLEAGKAPGATGQGEYDNIQGYNMDAFPEEAPSAQYNLSYDKMSAAGSAFPDESDPGF